MSSNFLKLNDDKTEVISFGCAQQLKKIEVHTIHIGDSLITVSHNVQNLGVQFDETRTMESHITAICKYSIYHLRNIARIRRYLTPSATQQIVHASVTSRLDVGNALLHRLPCKQIQRLQRAQNWAARLVVGATKFCRATPLLREQHWLPIAVRVQDATRRTQSTQRACTGLRRQLPVIEVVRKRARVFVGESIVRKTDRVVNKTDDVVVCLPGSKIEAITERVENIRITANKLKAEILNNQFKSVFTSENTNLPQEPNRNIPAMPDIIITTDGVAKLLHGLNPNKATGPDEVPAKILQLAANKLAPALNLIFQKSLTTGELPLSWLRANITPIFKKRDRHAEHQEAERQINDMPDLSWLPYDRGILTIAWVLSLTIHQVATLDYLPALNLVIDSPEWCGTHIYARNGYVYSHQKARELARGDVSLRLEAKENHYAIDVNCSLTIQAGLESRLLLQFPRRIDLECATDGKTCDCLYIFDGASRRDPLLVSVCGYREAGDLPPIESTQSTIFLLFVADGDCKNGEGFMVQFSAFRTVPRRLSGQGKPHCHQRKEFTCDTYRCLPMSFLCDNVTQCIDRTDETMPGCRRDADVYWLLQQLRNNEKLTTALLERERRQALPSAFTADIMSGCHRCRCSVVLLFATSVVFAAKDVGYESMPPDMNLFSHLVIGALSNCNGRVLRRNGYLYSHRSAFERLVEGEDLERKGLHYPDDINCTLNLCSGMNSRILVQFPRRIVLTCSSDKSTCDCLNVYDGPSTSSPLLKSFCRIYELDELKPFESSGPDLTFHFRTDKNCRNEEGFQLQFSAFRGLGAQAVAVVGNHLGFPRPGYTSDTTAKNRCDAGEEFACDDYRCIPRTFMCDDIHQCVDRTDEGKTGCSPEQQLCRAVLDIRPFFGYIVAVAVLGLLIIVLSVVGLCWWFRLQDKVCNVIGQRVVVVSGRGRVHPAPAQKPTTMVYASEQEPTMPVCAPAHKPSQPSYAPEHKPNPSGNMPGQKPTPSEEKPKPGVLSSRQAFPYDDCVLVCSRRVPMEAGNMPGGVVDQCL
ncbi:hypothetical protein LSAT2_028582 [Lamellibrachia satsuma]|nr:hypothetical protein LSAT2_028582 [Lamellibrachia satsuma]